jgi:DNA-binding MarR family transcriptional regulator
LSQARTTIRKTASVARPATAKPRQPAVKAPAVKTPAVTAPAVTAPAKTRVPTVARDAQVSSLINLAARLTNKAARIRMGAVGAWPGQIPILLWLLEEDGLIQRELVARSGMEQSTVAEHIDRMERDGLVVRRQSDDDRRTYHIHLTDRARAMSCELVGHLRFGARLFTRGVPADDLVVFMRVIEKIIGNLNIFVRTAEAEEAAPRPKKK